jgi:chromate reductase, NAD(P)H dehydrogenase (quinone)
MHILAISGSYRKGSFNLALLEEAKRSMPENSSLEILDVSRFPLYNKDIERNISLEVLIFKEKIRTADAILFATPEFNYSVSAVLKNAIEWGNRPDNSWEGKPAAIVSATTGVRGGVRSQMHLRHIMVDLNMYPLNEPELFLGNARDAFDDDMRLTNESAKLALNKLLQNLVSWAAKLK